jgi:hypothetical protein
MLYMVIENFKDGTGDAVYARFHERGRMLPENLFYVSSWVTPQRDRCFQLMECDDRRLLDEWAANWSDIVDFEFIPVQPSSTHA